MNDLSRRYAANRRAQFWCRTLEYLELKSWRDDHDDADREGCELLLILHSPIGGEQHIEIRFGAPKEITVPEGAPPLFLNRADLEIGKAPPQQPREVLVEQDALHAIFATSARLASSRNATACSRLTPG